MRGFVAEQMVARGMVADFAVHDVRARDGGRQPHAHVMTTTRAIDPAKPLGFGGKVRAWDDKALVLEWREAWAGHVNAALERARTPERVDHRTLEAQRLEAAAAGDFDRAAELDREPEPKVGFRAWALEREGVATERGDMLRSVQERNAERRAIYAEVAEAGERAKALFLEARQRAGDAFEAFESWARTAYVKVREWVMDIADGLHGLAHGGRPDEPALRPDRGDRHPGHGAAGREDAREQKPDRSEIGATARDRPRPEPDQSRWTAAPGARASACRCGSGSPRR